MIIIKNLAMTYGPRLLFDDVNLNLQDGHRYGLVGANGAGKTTFLQVLVNAIQPQEGTIVATKNSRISILKQDHYHYENDLILDVVIQGNALLWQALQRKYQLLKEPILTESMGYELSDLEEIIAAHDGYSAEAEAQKLLLGLGIKEEYHIEQLKVLSGGYKLRVLLAQVLFNNPDVLLLDEPTNYLDIASIDWLEKYLIEHFKGLLIFISHDQDFLNSLSTHILDIDYGEITDYVGNYDQFIKQKQLVVDQKLHERQYLEKKIAHMRVFVERFRASASRAKQSQSREKMIEKIELPDIQQSSRKSPSFTLTQKRSSGKEVLTLKMVQKQFDSKKIFNKINVTVMRGEKIAIIGRNGIGKSTLLKIIMGIIPVEHGSITWGHEASVSYVSQDQQETLHEQSTLLEWLGNQIPQETPETIRKTLGQMLFTKDDVHKKIGSLSGGETARLLFAELMLKKNNVLILDEPTNHLDLEARNALAQGLHAFAGTVLVVSHDRHFVSQVATRVIALTEKGVQDFQGTYAEFQQHYGIDYLSNS